MKRPNLNDYDIKVLILLGNQTRDEEFREDIKHILIEKLIPLNYSILYFLNNFSKSEGIIHEVYAEILMRMVCEKRIYINYRIMDLVIGLVSLDTLMKYGMESDDLNLSEKCKEEFWKRVLENENDNDLIKKKYK
jgi:hypothetical protein